MPTNHRRPPFLFGHVYQASKCVTINGVEMQPGEKLTAEQIAEVGEGRLRKIYDAKLIDYATDDLPHHYTVPGALVIGGFVPSADPEPIVVKVPDDAPALPVEFEPLKAADVATTALKVEPVAPAAPVEPAKAPEAVSGAHTAIHKGFGKWWIVDAAGEKVSGPHTEKVAKAMIDAAKVAGV